MMTSRKVLDYVSAEPFRPFRIRMASGQSFEIRHPEMILLGRASVRVHEPSEPDSGKPDHWHDVSLMLMETLEPIDSSRRNRKRRHKPNGGLRHYSMRHELVASPPDLLYSRRVT